MNYEWENSLELVLTNVTIYKLKKKNKQKPELRRKFFSHFFFQKKKFDFPRFVLVSKCVNFFFWKQCFLVYEYGMYNYCCKIFECDNGDFEISNSGKKFEYFKKNASDNLPLRLTRGIVLFLGTGTGMDSYVRLLF